MKRLFHNVIWPAVAGNVAWAFFTVLVEANWSDHSFWARLLALFAVAVYLAADWYNTDLVFDKINPLYWIADAFLAPLIALFAITAQASNTGGSYTYMIALVFVAAIVGHLFGAWDKTKCGTSAWGQRLIYVSINASGLVLLALGTMLASPCNIYSVPVAIAVVVAIFLAYVHKHR